MMRDGEALCRSRPDLFRDLLLSGVLFHDSGKLWENCYDEAGFSMPYSEFGELLGHITIGVELVNSLWRKATEQPAFAESTNAQPSHDQLRMHLLHLIVSHHGELEFGSPVLPKTPEAVVLHYLDNIDAKLEMLAGAYATGNPLSARIVERVRPLNSNLVRPLRNATEMG